MVPPWLRKHREAMDSMDSGLLFNSGRTFSAEKSQGFYHVHGQSTDQATRIGWESIEWIGSFLTTGDRWSMGFFGANDGEVFSMLANVQLFLGKFLGLKWIVM